MNLKSRYPYFLIKSGLIAKYPKLHAYKSTDMVLGGVVSGALSAYHLLQKGISCIVVNSRSIGLGITCASTSLLQKYIERPLVQINSTFALINRVLKTKRPFCKEGIFVWNTADPYLSLRNTPDYGISNNDRNKKFYSSAISDFVVVFEARCLVRDFKTLFTCIPLLPVSSRAGSFVHQKLSIIHGAL